MPKNKTALDALVEEGAAMLTELAPLERAVGKLSYDNFMAEAMQIAGIDKARLDEIERIVQEKEGTGPIMELAHRWAREFNSVHYCRPLRDPSKGARLFGRNEASAVLGQHGINSAELQCLAVRFCYRRFGANAFGTVKDMDGQLSKIENLQATRDALFEKMRSAVRGDDLEVDVSSLLPDERRRGLARVTFKRAPSVSLADVAWPQKLIDNFEPPEKKSGKRQRMKLDGQSRGGFAPAA